MSESEDWIATALLYVSLIQIGGVTSSATMIWLFNWDVNLALPLWLLCYGVALTGLTIRYRGSWLRWFFVNNRLLCVLLLFACLSLLWSVDKSATLKRTIHLVGISTLAIYIGSIMSFTEIVRHTALGLLIILVLSSFVSIVFPEFGLMTYEFDRELGNQFVWRGFADGKNSLGIMAVVGIFFGVALMMLEKKTIRENGVPIALILTGLLVLWKCDSATSIASMAICGVVISILAASGHSKFSPGLFIALCFFALVLAVLGSSLYEVELDSLTSSVSSLVGRSESMTGRVPLWAEAWDITLQQPFLGFGYGTIWGPAGAYSEGVYQDLVSINWEGDYFYISHAHNGFLNVSTQLGIPYAIMAMVPIFIFAWQCISGYLRQHKAEFLLLAGFTAMFVAYNVAEVSLFYSRNLLWLLFLVFVVNIHFTGKSAVNRAARKSSKGQGKRRGSKQYRRKKRKKPESTVETAVRIKAR